MVKEELKRISRKIERLVKIADSPMSADAGDVEILDVDGKLYVLKLFVSVANTRQIL